MSGSFGVDFPKQEVKMFRICNKTGVLAFLVILLSYLLIFPTTVSSGEKGIKLLVLSDEVVKGELLKVKKDALVILYKRGSAWGGLDVDINKITSISLKRKSKIGQGLLLGLLAGGTMGALAGRSQSGSKSYRELQGALGGVVFGLVGGVSGAGIGAYLTYSKGRYKEIYNKEKSIGILSNVLNFLNQKARSSNPMLKFK
jgi:hypothetical protein